ncbi:MAG TPA: hypothetical protein PKL16_02165, partial [Anaerolineae bacterium]|nr:hypothetical protein [Anaerolineae bacterium]HQM13093.1 hypothetical protein [Anaerolineae bacterium]
WQAYEIVKVLTYSEPSQFLAQKYQAVPEPPTEPAFAAFLRTPIQAPHWIPYTRVALHER